MPSRCNLSDVTTTVDYFADTQAANVINVDPIHAQWQEAIYPKKPVNVVVRDILGRESEFTLDTHGFQFVKHNLNSFNEWN